MPCLYPRGLPMSVVPPCCTVEPVMVNPGRYGLEVSQYRSASSEGCGSHSLSYLASCAVGELGPGEVQFISEVMSSPPSRTRWRYPTFCTLDGSGHVSNSVVRRRMDHVWPADYRSAILGSFVPRGVSSAVQPLTGPFLGLLPGYWPTWCRLCLTRLRAIVEASTGLYISKPLCVPEHEWTGSSVHRTRKVVREASSVRESNAGM